jgi:two-component system sensor histidine kinase BaeS
VVVGRLTLQAAPSSVQERDAAFLASQTRNILLAGLAALGLSLLAAWLLSRHLLAPIHDVTEGARRIADGWLDARIPVRRDDELGELAFNFNAMAERLAKVEESRRAWISDTSHELRTPLAVLRAEIEALQDGVRTPDASTLARLHKQVQQLATLVDDLRLSLDREPGVGNMEHLLFPPLAVLDEVITAFEDRYTAAGIALEATGLADPAVQMRGDAGHLTQVFTNLLENTLRYTNTGGRLRITAMARAPRLTLQFDDTAPAPPRSALPRLFERFFRAEPSRSRALGGSGLGLAICKALIEAHGGTITASLSELGGLSLRIELPLEKS